MIHWPNMIHEILGPFFLLICIYVAKFFHLRFFAYEWFVCVVQKLLKNIFSWCKFYEMFKSDFSWIFKSDFSLNFFKIFFFAILFCNWHVYYIESWFACFNHWQMYLEIYMQHLKCVVWSCVRYYSVLNGSI